MDLQMVHFFGDSRQRQRPKVCVLGRDRPGRSCRATADARSGPEQSGRVVPLTCRPAKFDPNTMIQRGDRGDDAGSPFAQDVTGARLGRAPAAQRPARQRASRGINKPGLRLASHPNPLDRVLAPALLLHSRGRPRHCCRGGSQQSPTSLCARTNPCEVRTQPASAFREGQVHPTAGAAGRCSKVRAQQALAGRRPARAAAGSPGSTS